MKTLKEIWKDVPGYEGYYLVSNYGNIKSLYGLHYKDKRSKLKGKVIYLKKIFDRGYLVVNLVKNKKLKKHRIHRLVAETFIKNPYPLKYKLVNHIDGDKSNNCINNLEWLNDSGNLKHSYKNKLRTAKGERNTQSKLTKEKVLKIREIRINENLSESKIAAMFKVSRGTIADILHKRIWGHI